MGAGDDRALGELFRAAGDGVHRHVRRAAGRTRERQPRAQRDEVVRGQRERRAREAEQRDQARGDPQAEAVERAPREQHRRQRARADEQQRQAELPVIDARLVLDARDRRSPCAPERSERGEGDVGRRDQVAGKRPIVAAVISAP